jgi:serine/threonine protein kinase/tetratricopeptide (TPR) repeat protein
MIPPVSDKPTESTPRGWRHALKEWLIGPETDANPAGPTSAAPAHAPPARIGHYRVERKIGEGGMGVVYAARDERLQRPVALKLMSELVGGDDTARQRFWREARAAAAVNHPNVCQIYEIGDDGGTLFIAMELLDGTPLADRLGAGPLPLSEAMPIALGMLAALSALHGRGLVHRDLKPSNVFLTRHGVKLLDFGLARQDLTGPTLTGVELTRSGMLVGTPRYMAPEQALGEPVDARSDLFSAGAILFEMLAGRPAFGGATIVDALHATVHDQPPALTGSPAISAVDRVIRRLLAKRPAERYASADEAAGALREIRVGDGDGTRAVARTLTRIVVLPFRVLRPDPETDFLAFSLPDAISTSLSGVSSLVVRSSAMAARFAGESPDLKVLASEADVDRVVMGSLLRSGDQVRATAQLVEAPAGTLITSQTIQSSLGDLFALQDDIARRVVDGLALPLGGEVLSPAPEAPRNPRAYEFYLRGNEMARSYDALTQARDQYLRAIELDPQFAPAWAQLGRCYRVIGKFVDGSDDSEARAEAAFQRALAIEPRLSVAHKFYAALEADIGRGEQAVVRLLHEASRHGNDPELFAGLVQTCRYCGLYDESIAADAEARRLDPNVSTSVEQTMLMTGELERLLAVEAPLVGGGDEGIRVMGLGLSGRREEARERLLAMREKIRLPAFKDWTDYLMSWLDRRPADMHAKIEGLTALKIQQDPEAIFLEGWLQCEVGAHESGLEHLQRAVAKGYYAVPTLARNRHFDALRSLPAFRAVLAQAESGRDRALQSFRDAGGERLLGRVMVQGRP